MICQSAVASLQTAEVLHIFAEASAVLSVRLSVIVFADVLHIFAEGLRLGTEPLQFRSEGVFNPLLPQRSPAVPPAPQQCS